MTKPVLFTGIDAAVPLTYEQCTALKKANYSFVCRYYTEYWNPKHEWKMLFKSEALAISQNNLDLVVIYQAEGLYSKIYSKETGKSDCLNAIKCAEMIGQPYDTTIYFAVDTNIIDQNKMDDINNYFVGIYQTMTIYRKAHFSLGWNLGAYGNYYVIEYIYGRNGIYNCWQTSFWSNKLISNKALFLQHKFDFPTCGIDAVDENIAFSHGIGKFRIKS